MIKRVVIIGAGPAGLATASGLRKRGVETLTLERASVAGGMARSIRRDGWLAELGPHSFRFRANRTPAALTDSGLDKLLTDTLPGANKRFVTSGGKPVVAPWRALGLPGSLRLAFEPFAATHDGDEPVADFFRRRLGRRAHERLGDAFVGGIHAGDPEKLSITHAFPELKRFEREHGSLFRGMFATRAARRDAGPARIAAFAGGMSTLSDTLAARLGDSLRTGAIVSGVAKTASGWRVAWTGADGVFHEDAADAVVVATPTGAWPTLGLPGAASALLRDGVAPPSPPVAVVTLGFDRRHVAHALDGFGVLTPARENRVSLGILFPSSVFPDRAPHEGVTLAVFIGGVRRPELARLGHDDLVALAKRECELLLGATVAPSFVHVSAWREAIPQYTLAGHADYLKALAETEAALPGLRFVGNHRGGVSLTAALDNGEALAAELAS